MNEFNLYFQLGIEHILSISSWDHLLFLVSLIIVFEPKDYKKVLGVISLFAIAHTFSLFLSAQQFIKVNENWIEILILYTILITASTNIIIKTDKWLSKIHYFFAFFFGLIHGLGFARDFRMLVSGNDHIVLPLLEFTLGIEIGQVVASIFIMLLVFILTKLLPINKKELVNVVSGGIVGYILAMLNK
jgi:hypothetical protein